MARYFLELAYNGKHFHGWQKQPNAITVQQTLEQTLSTVIQSSVLLTGAGRTDTGVHASYFVAHFDMEDPLPFEENVLLRKLNSMLPSSIAVYSMSQVSDEAHSRFSAIRRSYEYHMILYKDPFLEEVTHRPWFVPDFDRMNLAAERLKDYTDFTSFARLHGDNKTNFCKISDAFWEKRGNRYVFVISADRFLRNMVRAIVGTLLDVGRGKISVNDFCEIIEAQDRCLAGTSAPPQGLFLTDIKYPEKIFSRKWRGNKSS
ncbi:MAG: tRNA pseudouridine38-40 synthase [Anaerophaga sp.]|uniref:tRNA pseudouridine(38-40) synthase TruA n=1 Tax=Anaerophaga thermohalophila TaxID=177400 RepID=UPI000237BD30|nr:tRNA pseudouridine(38-40) synthase TruA [Anaerophaga thermohalophila]MDK2842365.1 tRNA pseudouridine38-40 synthase [Anaerophaga sp.]MDN5292619.1 tRNA pseudouridine38-40 synthase [Anaerophaga sp.]